MKKIIILLAFLVFHFGFGQNNTVLQGRVRVSKTTATTTVTTTWQTVDFSGTSTDNTNTFGKDPVTGNNMVWWDSTNKLFRFYGDYDRNYSCYFYPLSTTTGLTTRSVLQYRMVIPNGGGAGVDKYFPYSDLGASAYGDVGEVTILSTGVNHNPIPIPLTAGPIIRANGCYLQVRLSTAIALGSCTLNTGTYFYIQE